MNLRTFIERPVLSAVISITIVVVGIIGLFTLPVEQYPDIAPPTIMVSTSYFGASAETLQKSVISPLEEAINGVEDMTYMTSSATNAGTVSITVYFKQGTDPDMAAVNVQNRVSKATGQLPAEVTQVGVTTSKRQTSILQMFSLSSPDDPVADSMFCSASTEVTSLGMSLYCAITSGFIHTRKLYSPPIIIISPTPEIRRISGFRLILI